MANESNIASIIDFNQFRCTLCKKYLSVPPIYMFTAQSKHGENICGRCKIPEGVGVSRNKVFESMAQYHEFPCINSKNCSRKLRWDEVEKHEAECGLLQCVICLDFHPVTKIVSHFEQLHRKNLFLDSILVATEEEIGTPKSTHQFLMITSKEPYMISTNANHIVLQSNVMLTVKVTPLLESFKFRTFTITFSNKNHTFVFKNKLIKRHDNVDDWVSHIFNLTTLKQLFLPDESALKIELKIDHATKKTTSETKPSLFEELANKLYCPICKFTMNGKIIVCRRGHSICKNCKNNCISDGQCPICRSPFTVHRNFALEDVCKKLNNFALII